MTRCKYCKKSVKDYQTHLLEHILETLGVSPE